MTENLWRLHREKIRPRDAADDEVIAIDALQGVDNRCGARRPAVCARQLENTLDQIRPNERTGGVMDRDKVGVGARVGPGRAAPNPAGAAPPGITTETFSKAVGFRDYSS